MQNKKGVSDVISTVLIILVVIVAVGILAGFLLNAVQKGAPEISGASACITLTLEPQSCNVTSIAGGKNETTVLVKRVRGEAELSKVKLIFDVDGKSVIFENKTEVPGAYEVAKIVSVIDAGFPGKVTVVGFTVDKAGQETPCQESVPAICR